MGFSMWLCVLCLQASLLSHAEASQGEACVGGRTADRQLCGKREPRPLPLDERLDLVRRKRQLERRGPTHLSHSSLPGAFSVKGFPNTLIQADRSRRHLTPAVTKKNRRPRPGTFSLLSFDRKDNPLQVTRVRRQVKLDPPKRGKSGRSGAFSVLGDPTIDEQTDRPQNGM
ncbi:uncharacterized protein si:dkey-12l12.1 [Nothobranchius furzeri]|uniref:LOC107382953-like protein n=2 Tax=Nothobranchius TaxID=28779 RepID=A0A1A8A4A3_NOTFU|nr:uncharacterized protein si:dkey-12l12.1 [Nothobranchius furzeri]KAF7213992.1 putative LOC107382953-like protein [Nothobranchius furzeri]